MENLISRSERARQLQKWVAVCWSIAIFAGLLLFVNVKYDFLADVAQRFAFAAVCICIVAGFFVTAFGVKSDFTDFDTAHPNSDVQALRRGEISLEEYSRRTQSDPNESANSTLDTDGQDCRST